jgi:competence protein ComEA
MWDRVRDRLGWRAVATAGLVPMVAAMGFLGWHLSAPGGSESVANEAIAAQGHGPNRGPNAGSGSSKTVVVYVSGEVARPGMYRLAAGLRVGDALVAAGGVLADADQSRMPNVAARLTDGKQIKVPRPGQSGSGSAKLDINTASEAQLDGVPGMPPGLAHEIVSFREQYGPFAGLAELKTVLGVDSATLAAIRKYLVAG